MLILHGLPALHWALAGLGLGLVTLVLLGVGGNRLGVSTGFENLCALVSSTPYLRRAELRGSHGYRLPFTGGLVLGGLLSAVLGGGWAPSWALGMFDTQVGWGPAGKVAWMFAGGLFVGFGTRLAGGCTSGHGIFGISNGEKASIVTTLAFMGAGLVTTNLVYRVVFPH